MEQGAAGWPGAFALVYFTFFLDNVLLTVLVPIIPDWIRGESLALWAAHEAPLALLLNDTVRRIPSDETGVGASQAAVGLVLSAKALAQLACAAPAAAAVWRRGPAPVLRRGTALLLLAALACGGRGGAASALLAGAGRAAQGAGAALAAVAGLALAADAVPARHKHRALSALLGAVALGVLVGYPCGGAAYKLWSHAAPFQIIAAALAVNLGLQYWLLSAERFSRAGAGAGAGGGGGGGAAGGWAMEARAGCLGACAGAVLASTCAVAALEPCLPLWVAARVEAARWARGAVFVPDSAAYLAAAHAAPAAARALGAERVALAGQAAVGCGALAVPLARSLAALALPQALLGAGLGALDGALVPALLARRGARAPHAAALLTGAAAAAYALGPAAGGALAAAAGFDSTMRLIGVANLLYAAYLYRALAQDPLSEQWGAEAPTADAPEGGGAGGEPHYSTFH